ncbi:hypothetical protein [Dictyobacter kobayashii]|uniref:Uncharacterized protein n=1 Tax=Dictyobacter kobayashii TaxID=2014872 RepID=A0A402AHU7_9CHLR|nr:hypothetical protein [Dictyobacter kobayashii]GCE18677.1 hypothetical protein KDK_24770 [Dictyobacter kobayashii]
MRKQREILPSDYHVTIAEIERRFYPLHISTSEDGRQIERFSPYYWSFEDSYSIPYALGPRHTTGLVSFPTYADAVTFCHREREEVDVLLECRKKAARCEVYPERNAWYGQEIEHLTGNAPFHYSTLFEEHAMVTDTYGTIYSLEALTLDEAMCQLYERVCAERPSPSTQEQVTV